jgi:transcriptional regulator with XRE-family HTH domain
MKFNNLSKIGDRIRICRVEKKLSQENLAHDLGISTTAYSRIERGLTNVSIARLEQIAECLNVPLARLMHTYDDVYKNTDSTDSIFKDPGYNYPELDPQILLKQIDDLQKNLSRANKALEDKDEIIALLKEKLSRN